MAINGVGNKSCWVDSTQERQNIKARTEMLEERLNILENEVGRLQQGARERNVRINEAFRIIARLESETKTIDQFIRGFGQLVLQR